MPFLSHKINIFYTQKTTCRLTIKTTLLYLQCNKTKEGKMEYKSPDDKLLERKSKEIYQRNFQNLLDLVPGASVFKKDESFEVDGVYLPATRWFISYNTNLEHSEYSISSELQQVYSIEAFDVEWPLFKLAPKDYNKLVNACEQRIKVLRKAAKQR